MGEALAYLSDTRLLQSPAGTQNSPRTLLASRPPLRPIKFFSAVPARRSRRREEELLQLIAKEAGDNQTLHVPTADQVECLSQETADQFNGSGPSWSSAEDSDEKGVEAKLLMSLQHGGTSYKGKEKANGSEVEDDLNLENFWIESDNEEVEDVLNLENLLIESDNEELEDYKAFIDPESSFRARPEKPSTKSGEKRPAEATFGDDDMLAEILAWAEGDENIGLIDHIQNVLAKNAHTLEHRNRKRAEHKNQLLKILEPTYSGGGKGRKAMLLASRPNPQSHAAPGRATDIASLARQIRRFVADPYSPQLMVLPLADGSTRREVHRLAAAFGLRSGKGRGKARYITLSKTWGSGGKVNENMVEKIVRRARGADPRDLFWQL
ncbi:hypothetical protein P691DRAFT_810275 [Macrolepiota fuliginosa MF-IS2]|uniref:R3H domain-containing protein n=1 Tax=Macrolepiota fuliginosa MF-IS2 TaxID=1400762 RepID=A0A9P5XHL0_9AGAR|nr:hypothetical protein P691DRAFT_810275 [Macrolepiota fuliginosa MF-IS2]